MNLDEQFGPHEGRPDHPDFVRLVEIINEQDDHATANLTDSAKYEAHLAHFADPVGGAMMTLWLDAFMAGYLFANPQTEPKETDADG
jgi:hypothetical protein